MRIRGFDVRLSFRHPFTTSKGTKTHQPALVVCIEVDGIKGWGEAPAISYYDVTVERMLADLEACRSVIEEYDFTGPEAFHQFLMSVLPDRSFLVCALDMAGWDLHGRQLGRSLTDLWDLDPERAPVSDFTIGMDDVPKMLGKMQAQPWPVYKIKVGGSNDLRVLEALRTQSDAPFRVDANAGWSLAEALELLPHLSALGVELVEQPLAKGDAEGMRRLMAVSPLPLFADESCVGEADVADCTGLFHGINIKLTKCGGITPALRMVAEARRQGLGVMIGSMSESTIGSSAIAHLAPLADHLDNDGTLLLDGDVATGLRREGGRILASGRPGLGVEVYGFR